jgi:4'-phosphopantetheinyl transferase
VAAIDIWYLQPDTLGPGTVDGLVTAEERGRAGRFRRDEDARRFLASRALLRMCLAERLGVDPGDVIVDRRCAHCGHADHGRPTPGGAELEFSLTRAGDVVAIALATCAVGIDAEPERDVADLAGSQVFSGEDRELLRTSAYGVLDLWVAKEAIGKASGLGLLDAQRIRCSPAAQGWSPATDALGEPCSVTFVSLPGAAAAAVAIHGTPGAVNIHRATVEQFQMRSTR